MKWLKQPGIVKKLQIALVVSVCLNLGLALNKLPKEKVLLEEKVESKEFVKETSELEIKNFIKSYLNYFFSTGLVAQSFIQKHSGKDLFEVDLKPQLEMRTKKDLKSNFTVLDFYIETEAEDQFRVILVGIESFENKDYQNREITMILKLEKTAEKFIISSVPKFEVKQ